jgi:dTDP-4-dehydrorhamnose reductase
MRALVLGVRPVLVTGGGGQLATALEAALIDARLPIRRVGRPVFDFERPETLDACVGEIQPGVIVNAAAYTAVDAAETDEDAARRANAEGPARLARLAQQADVPIVHVSTDYVFDGDKGAPYVETDATNPTCVYGRTKLDGERAVLEASARAIILRTSWVYSPGGKNFVRTMLNAAQKTNTLRVVADQKGCPTAAADLADAIVSIVARIADRGFEREWTGVYHACGTGWTTWHGLATATFEAAARHGRNPPEVTPIATADWPTPTRRPADSRLDCGRLAAVFGVTLPHWRDSLAQTVDRMLA